MVIVVELLVFVNQSINYDYIILKFINITLYYFIILYYIIFYLAFILLLIYILFKGKIGKFKLERSRLWQLYNSRRKACGGGGNTIQDLFSSDLHFL